MEIEPIQFIAGSLRIRYVFIDNKCRTFRVGSDTLTNLSGALLVRSPRSSRSIPIEILDAGLAEIAASLPIYIPNRTEFAKQIKEFFRRYVVAIFPNIISPVHLNLISMYTKSTTPSPSLHTCSFLRQSTYLRFLTNKALHSAHTLATDAEFWHWRAGPRDQMQVQ